MIVHKYGVLMDIMLYGQLQVHIYVLFAQTMLYKLDMHVEI